MATDNTVRWTTSEVVGVEEVATDVRRITLAPAEAVHARPGTHIDVRLGATLDDHHALPARTGTLTRSYSVVESQDDGRVLTLTVQLSPSSRGGSRRVHSLRIGDHIATTLPLQNFPLGVGASHYVLLAGGIGITALVAMAETLRARGADYRLIIVGRTRTALPYLDRLATSHGSRLHVHIDDEGTGLDVGKLVRSISDGKQPHRTELYMCGPIRLMDAVKLSWKTHNLRLPNLRFETFGNSGSWAPEPFVVRLAGSGREVTVPADSTALEALERAGMAVMADCRKGECGLCAVRVRGLSGRIDHRDVFFDDDQKAASDQLCLCVSRVARSTVDYFQEGRLCATITVELP